MFGETNLTQLLKSMEPKIHPEEYVFCCVSIECLKSLNPSLICQFRESEGITLVITKQEAENASLDHQYVSRMITLSIHSSLEAVGFLAAITHKLAENKISVNAVSACYYDRLFVPVDKAEQAMQVLIEMSHHTSAGGAE